MPDRSLAKSGGGKIAGSFGVLHFLVISFSQSVWHNVDGSQSLPDMMKFFEIGTASLNVLFAAASRSAVIDHPRGENHKNPGSKLRLKLPQFK